MIETIDNFAIEWLFGSNSAIVDNFALRMTNAFTWVPMYIALLILIIKNNDNMRQIMLCFGCGVLGVLLASVMSNVIAKPLVERLRPCNTMEIKYLVQIAGNLHNKDFSFFSSHAANTMSLAVFFTLLVRSSYLSITLFLWSLLNCWTRIYLGQHFMTDIMVGLVWGICVGLIAYFVFRKIYKRISPRLNFVSSQYTSTGYSQLDIDVVMSVIGLTLIYGLIPLF